MAPNSSEITVAANGTIYVANITSGTAVYPTTTTAAITTGTAAGSYAELGYATEDGVTFTITPSVEDINAWQSATPVRRLTTAREFTAATSLLQWNNESFSTAFGGGSWTTSGTPASYRFDPPADDEALAEFAVIIDAQDGTRRQRWVIERANVTEAVETNIVRSGAAVLPVTWSALTRSGQTRAWYFMSNDAAFA